MKKVMIEKCIHELEQTTAILGFIQTAFAEGSSLVNMEEASNAVYMLYCRQSDSLKELKDLALA